MILGCGFAAHYANEVGRTGVFAMKYICIIQTRTNSSRLPGKCFLPFGDFTLVELCAKRAETEFSQTWVAISDAPSDDLLAHRLAAAQIPFFRGGLDNVLDRFYSLCSHQNIEDDDVVIRLTGDNPIVDGVFLEKMRQVWEKNNLDYLSAEPSDLKKFGWPKGLSAEFFKAGLLYASKSKSTDAYNFEHVTPYIRETATEAAHMGSFEKMTKEFKHSFGVDTLDDFLFVSGLFNKAPWNASYETFLELGSE